MYKITKKGNNNRNRKLVLVTMFAEYVLLRKFLYFYTVTIAWKW